MANPFKFFSNIPSIIELFLQHLDSSDLLQLSTVNKELNNFILTECIDDIKLTIDKLNAPELLSDRTDQSERSLYHPLSDFTNIKIMLPIANIKPSEIFEELPGLRFLEIEGSFLIMDFLRQIEPYCQELEQLKICRHADDRTNYEALTGDWEENLDLEWANIKAEFYNFSFENVKTLSISSVNHVVAFEIIKRCPKLTDLTLNKIRSIDQLLNRLPEGTQKLKKLFVSEHSFYNFNQQKPELLRCLQAHHSSLEVLKFDVWIGLSNLQLIFEMPNLTQLDLYEVAKCDPSIVWDEVVLPANKTITRLNIQDLKCNIQLLERLLRACTNLKMLKIYDLSPESFTVILSNARKLNVLKAEFVSGELQSIYDYLQ